MTSWVKSWRKRKHSPTQFLNSRGVPAPSRSIKPLPRRSTKTSSPMKSTRKPTRYTNTAPRSMHDCLLSTRPTSDVYVVSSRESANAALPDAIALSTPVSLFEHWINAVWDGKIALPLPEGIQTVGQLIAWLSNREPAYIPFSI